MSKRYDYKIFPTTVKARLLLGLAFLVGLAVMAGYFVLFFAGPFGFGFFSFGWFDEIDVTYVNRTDTTIVIYLDEDLEVTILPRGEATVGYRKIEWWWNRDVEARTLSGQLVSATSLDRDDLERLDYRIIIDD
jgi:hypothetical protein